MCPDPADCDTWVASTFGADPGGMAAPVEVPPPPPVGGEAAGGGAPAAGGADPNKKWHDLGFQHGSLGGAGVCPATDQAGTDAYEQGYAAGKKAHDRRKHALELADASVSGDSKANDADTGLVAQQMAEKMPVKEMEALAKAGIKVKVTRRAVTEYLTELKDEHPRDYPGGAKWDSVPGTYWAKTKEIVIATQDAGGGKRKMPGSELSSSADVFEHEAAHALNRTGASGLLSDAPDFVAAYDKDAKSGKLAQEYYHQKGTDGKDSSDGRDEAFAESNAMYITDPAAMKTAYPDLYEYWHAKLADD